jgi:hypothetical protein
VAAPTTEFKDQSIAFPDEESPQSFFKPVNLFGEGRAKKLYFFFLL